VLAIHREQLALFGGADGIRDRGLLESAVAQPMATFGENYLHGNLYAIVFLAGNGIETKDLLRKVGDRLSGDRRKQAEAVFKELRSKGAQPFASAFK